MSQQTEQALLQMGFEANKIKRLMQEHPGHDAEFYANMLLISSAGSSTPPLPHASVPVSQPPQTYASALLGPPGGALYQASLPRDIMVPSGGALVGPTVVPTPHSSHATVSPRATPLPTPVVAPATPTHPAPQPPAISMAISTPSRQVATAAPATPITPSTSNSSLVSVQTDHSRIAGVTPAVAPALTEDNDLLKAIENSLVDQGGKAETREPIDPSERMRVEGLPVGLRNAGNTCYFNSIVHIYNFLPPFRNGLLLALPPLSPITPQETFIVGLQKLFAELLRSQRRYVDPGPVIRLLLESSGQKHLRLGNQEDPTEFNMLFLDSAKKGLLSLAGADPLRAEAVKRMFRLFRGTQVTEIFAKEKDGITVDIQRRPEKFKHLIVALRSDVAQQSLYQALDEYTAPTDIDNYTTEKGFVTRATRHVSFDELPAVLTVQIQRASFDRVTNQSAKLNASFHFPKVLSLDRYLEINRSDTLSRRQRIREIQTQVMRLDTRLNGLRFREQNGVADAVPIDTHLAAVVAHFDARHRAAPSVGEKYELNVVLSRLRIELASIRAQVSGLEHEREQRKAEIDSMFDGPSKHSYTLHAVLVHDGRESKSGHYWAFLNDRANNRWLKFNDIHVSVVNEETVWRESTGGPQQNSSAYCLVYISDSLSMDFTSPQLHPLLASHVESSNQQFAEELRQWRDSRAKSSAISSAAPSSGLTDRLGRPAGVETSNNDDPISQLVEEFRRRYGMRLETAINDVTIHGDEARLRSVAHYLMSIPGNDDLVQFQVMRDVLEEMFPKKPLSDIRQTAFYQRLQREYNNEMPSDLSIAASSMYRHHREDYSNLLTVMDYYVSGVELGLQDQWLESLPFALHARQKLQSASVALVQSGSSNRNRKLESELLEFARISLLHVSGILASQVELGGYEMVAEAVKLADVAVDAVGHDCVIVLLRKDWERVLDLLRKRHLESRDPAIDLNLVERVVTTYRSRSSMYQKRLAEPVRRPSSELLYLRYRRCKQESAGKWLSMKKRIADESSGIS